MSTLILSSPRFTPAWRDGAIVAAVLLAHAALLASLNATRPTPPEPPTPLTVQLLTPAPLQAAPQPELVAAPEPAKPPVAKPLPRPEPRPQPARRLASDERGTRPQGAHHPCSHGTRLALLSAAHDQHARAPLHQACRLPPCRVQHRRRQGRHVLDIELHARRQAFVTTECKQQRQGCGKTLLAERPTLRTGLQHAVASCGPRGEPHEPIGLAGTPAQGVDQPRGRPRFGDRLLQPDQHAGHHRRELAGLRQRQRHALREAQAVTRAQLEQQGVVGRRRLLPGGEREAHLARARLRAETAIARESRYRRRALRQPGGLRRGWRASPLLRREQRQGDLGKRQRNPRGSLPGGPIPLRRSRLIHPRSLQ